MNRSIISCGAIPARKRLRRWGKRRSRCGRRRRCGGPAARGGDGRRLPRAEPPRRRAPRTAGERPDVRRTQAGTPGLEPAGRRRSQRVLASIIKELGGRCGLPCGLEALPETGWSLPQLLAWCQPDTLYFLVSLPTSILPVS